MAGRVLQKIFVIYGRNLAAYREISKFLKAIGVNELTFEEVANRQAAPYVTDVVVSGIKGADAIIVLFTPDELCTLYGTSLQAGVTAEAPTESRWQVRPNVIFEAGIAFGLKRDRTIIVAIGEDVSQFSDIGGVHFVRLDNETGKQGLRDRLGVVLSALPTLKKGWHKSTDSGDFSQCVTKRWQPYDELFCLETFLRSQHFSQTVNQKQKPKGQPPAKSSISLLETVEYVVLKSSRNWSHAEPRDFIQFIKDHFNDRIADDSYWWLTVAGFFRFHDIYLWLTDEHWDKSVDYTEFALRGLALIDKIQITK